MYSIGYMGCEKKFISLFKIERYGSVVMLLVVKMTPLGVTNCLFKAIKVGYYDHLLSSVWLSVFGSWTYCFCNQSGDRKLIGNHCN